LIFTSAYLSVFSGVNYDSEIDKRQENNMVMKPAESLNHVKKGGTTLTEPICDPEVIELESKSKAP
jgi:hypothetical protein